MRADYIETVRQRASVRPASLSHNVSQGDIETRARELQGKYFAGVIRRAVANLVRRFAAARKRRRDYAYLEQMNDRQLSDIGLIRSDIRKVVFGVRPTLRQRLAAAWKRFRAWRRRRAAYLELMTLDDHVLRDIGMSRSQLEFALRNHDEAGYTPANLNEPRNAA